MMKLKSETKFIAEVCSNHNRNLKRCFEFIDSAKKLNCYAVKFQLFKIKNLFSKDAKKLYKNVQRKKKRELPKEFIPKIAKYCKRKKIKFSCTPFDLESVDFLKKYVDFFKIASYELSWTSLLEKCAKSKKPIILSTGMSNLKEVKKAVSTLKKNKCKKISLLHCVSSYPASISSCNLKSIPFLTKKFNCEVGWSDHTVEPLIIYSAIKNFGAKIIEFHYDLDGNGWEQKEGGKHCWLPEQIKRVIDYNNKEKVIDGKYQKKFSKEEKIERKFRADPKDGLRPLLKFRKSL